MRVLVRVGGFQARRWQQLVAGVHTCAEAASRWLVGGRPLAVRVSTTRSKLYHAGGIQERVHKTLEAALGVTFPVAAPTPPEPEPGPDDADGADAEAIAAPIDRPAPPQTVFVRVIDNRVTVSVDTSGEPLHRRGYRLETGRAPLREDLARGLVVVSDWSPDTPLFDPFCGSGTIGIEADWFARRVPPGHLRAFAFADAPCFDAAAWERVRAAALAGVLPTRAAPILLSDRDAGVVASAQRNAARAGAELTIVEAALGYAPWVREPPETVGAVVTNPPYGQRVARGQDLRPLFQSLGRQIRASLPVGTRVALVSDDRQLVRQLGIFLRACLLTDHGGIKVSFMIGETRPRR